jgi:hypothetical protein
MLYKNYSIKIERKHYRYFSEWQAYIYDGDMWYWHVKDGYSPKHIYDLAKIAIDLYEKYPNYYCSM